MFIAITGVGPDGKRVERSWHLLAEGEDGPLIPSMAIAAIVRQGLDGRKPSHGARPVASTRYQAPSSQTSATAWKSCGSSRQA